MSLRGNFILECILTQTCDESLVGWLLADLVKPDGFSERHFASERQVVRLHVTWSYGLHGGPVAVVHQVGQT